MLDIRFYIVNISYIDISRHEISDGTNDGTIEIYKSCQH